MPQMHWDPATGLPVVFGDDEVPPAHFLPHHPDDAERLKEKLPPEPEPIKALTKVEVTDALKAGGIEFDKTAKLADLTALLVTNLKAALAAADKPFSDDDAPRTLLEIVTGKTTQ